VALPTDKSGNHPVESYARGLSIFDWRVDSRLAHKSKRKMKSKIRKRTKSRSRSKIAM